MNLTAQRRVAHVTAAVGGEKAKAISAGSFPGKLAP